MRRRGKKGEVRIETEYLDQALATFSGYLAADEVYDGPFCVLAIVDNHTFQRLACRVLDHDPSQRDVREFFADFKAHLDARGLKVRGITTDGSSLYPDVIAELFTGAAPPRRTEPRPARPSESSSELPTCSTIATCSSNIT